MFVDQVQIVLLAGDGGDGCSALARQPFSRFARPSGGNGGDGGDVILVADPQASTLLDFQFRHEFHAGQGRHGSGNTKTGKRGADCIIRVPVGTVLYDIATGCLLRDLVQPGERVVVARGGRGGLGNATRSTPRRGPPPHALLRKAKQRGVGPCSGSSRVQSRDATATRATPGKPGERRQLRLELKLIADVGIVGFPNAGKSSLLSRISTARPKAAPYPFTTRTPVLGVVSVGTNGSFVACDIPGLIEGAHEGRGLGIEFLRHIERTKLLIHLIDMAAVDGRDPVEDFTKLNEELAAYSPSLSKRPQLVVANKMDLLQAHENLRRFQAAVSEPVFAISCVTKDGIPGLVQAVWQRLNSVEPVKPVEPVLPVNGPTD